MIRRSPMTRQTKRSLTIAMTLVATAVGTIPLESSGQSPSPRVAPAASGPFEYDSLQQAWQVAQQSQVPVLLFVTSDHCYYCKKMVAETYQNPQLAPLFARLFETASVKQAEAPELVAKLGVRLYPTTLVISPTGKLLGRMEGHIAPDEIGRHLNPLLIRHRESLAATTNRSPHQIAAKGAESL